MGQTDKWWTLDESPSTIWGNPLFFPPYPLPSHSLDFWAPLKLFPAFWPQGSLRSHGLQGFRGDWDRRSGGSVRTVLLPTWAAFTPTMETAFFPRLAFSEIVCGTAATVVDPSGDDLLQRLELSLAQVFGGPHHAAAADLVSDTDVRHRPTSLDWHANVLLCYLCKTSPSTRSPHNPACFRCSVGFSVNAALEGPGAPQQLRVIFQRKTLGKK